MSMGEVLQNLSFSKVSKQVVTSFCVAGAALFDVPNLFDNMWKAVLCGRRNTFVSFSQDELQIVAAVFLAGAEFWRSLSSFCVRGATLQT